MSISDIPLLKGWHAEIAHAIRIVVLLAGAWLATLAVRRLIGGLGDYTMRMMLKHGDGAEAELQKRAATIARMLARAASLAIWSVAFVMALQEMNFDVRPLIAGAGVVGLAVGFGAQNLIKDLLSGLFLLIDNQIRINDVAVINGTSGTVEEINLRTTVLRSENGAVHIFPNGSIATLSNLTREYSYYVLEITISHRQDTDRALAAIKETAEQVSSEEPYGNLILAPLEVLGVDRFNESGVVLKARIKARPSKQWTVGREMNRRLYKRFEQDGIGLSTKTISVQVQPSADWFSREEVKQIVREVMAETGRPGSQA